MMTRMFLKRCSFKLLRAISRGQSKPLTPESDKGLTLLEAIVAIAVIAVTGAAITPALFLATATRYQNQRAEQALQLAQGEIDRVRTLVDQGKHFPNALPATVPNDTNLQGYTPPTGASVLKSTNDTCNAYTAAVLPIATQEALQIDVDGDCAADFLVQVFRTEGSVSTREVTSGDNRPTEFSVGVRVYANSASGNWPNLSTEPASLRFTTGEGNQRVRPLAVLYSRMNWGDTDFALCQYHGDCSSPTPPATP